MRRVLNDAFKGHCIKSAKKRTTNGLVSRGYLNSDLSLTKEGKLYLISRLPLGSQCMEIGVPLIIQEWDKSSKPEIWVSRFFAELGFTCAHCEGGAIGFVIKGMCLDALTKTSYFYGTSINAREDACLKGIVCLSNKNEKDLERIFADIIKTSRKKYLLACEEILSYPAISEWYPGLTMDFAEKMFKALSKEQYVKIARWISLDFEHRNGWPDLTLVKDQKVSFIEVKTTDKLHYSQLVTLPPLKNLIGLDIKVIKLTKKRKINK